MVSLVGEGFCCLHCCWHNVYAVSCVSQGLLSILKKIKEKEKETRLLILYVAVRYPVHSIHPQTHAIALGYVPPQPPWCCACPPSTVRTCAFMADCCWDPEAARVPCPWNLKRV